MNALKEAKTYAQNLDGDGRPERYERNAYRAMALALIAIAEELRAINEREAMKIEWEADLPIDRTPEQIADRAMEELDRINDELPY